MAPFKDLKRNYDAMKKDNYDGNDKFFHCKANYEAAKRGKWGEFVGKAMSAMREFPYGTIKVEYKTALMIGKPIAEVGVEPKPEKFIRKLFS